MIGIIAAHEAELEPLLRPLAGRRRHEGIIFGQWRGRPVALRVVGQGWARAHERTLHFLRTVRPAGVVMTGFAGATAAGWAVGDVVMPDKVVDLRRGEEAADGPSYRPALPVAAWRAQLGFRGGVVGTVEAVVVEPWDKAELGRRAGIAAVDLETAAMADAATQEMVPWVVARVVLDPVDRPLAVVSAWHAALLAVSVTGWGRLGRFGRDLTVAQRQLGDRIGDVVEIMDRTLANKDGS